MTHLVVTIDGRLEGLVACESAAQHGPLSFAEDDEGQVTFRLTVTVGSEDEAEQVIEAAPAAIAAMCAISWGVWVGARPIGWSITRPDGTERVGKAVGFRTRVRADLSMRPTMTGGSDALDAALLGKPERALVLLNLFGLGLRASQSADYVSGLWAFSTVVEETAPKGKNNIDHAPALAQQLRASGLPIPKDPQRRPAEIRASALHPTPKSHLPSFEEVQWLTSIARAYLADQLAGLTLLRVDTPALNSPVAAREPDVSATNRPPEGQRPIMA
jgi:hypothetical protein